MNPQHPLFQSIRFTGHRNYHQRSFPSGWSTSRQALIMTLLCLWPPLFALVPVASNPGRRFCCQPYQPLRYWSPLVQHLSKASRRALKMLLKTISWTLTGMKGYTTIAISLADHSTGLRCSPHHIQASGSCQLLPRLLQPFRLHVLLQFIFFSIDPFHSIDSFLSLIFPIVNGLYSPSPAGCSQSR